MLIVGDGAPGTLNISGGNVIVSGSAGTVVTGNSSGTGTINFSGGALSAALVTNARGNGNAGTVNFTTTTSATFTPSIGGSVKINQTGIGDTFLTGSSTTTGATTVNAGTLTINGFIGNSAATVSGSGVLNGSGTTGNVTVNSGGTLGGSLSSGTVSGAGMVAPGGSQILTVSMVNPGSGMSYNFHMSQAGEPTYSNSAASGNDVLHLTGATPLVSALTSASTITVDFTGLVLQSGQIYYGGFFTDAAIANSMVQNATFSYTGLGGAVVQFEGMTTVASAPFVTGTVSNGEVMQFDVTQGPPVPAAPPWALLLAGAGLLIAGSHKVKTLRNTSGAGRG